MAGEAEVEAGRNRYVDRYICTLEMYAFYICSVLNLYILCQ